MAKEHQIVLGSTWGIRNTFQSLVAILTTILVVTAIYLTQEGGQWSQERTISAESLSKCNLFSGKWVFDNESYPLYKEQQCTFMSDQLACEKFGRKDLNYQNWRWKPHQCDLPRGQWVSMVCLVETSLLPSLKSMHTIANGSLNIFKAIEYNATIEFYWAPLLVESNSDDPVNHRVPERTVRVQAIEKHARYWTDADIVVFNTFLWWRRRAMNVLWGSFGDPDGVYKKVPMVRVYEMALRTWSDWLEVHINRNKTQLFFASMSPTHQKAHEWGGVRETIVTKKQIKLQKRDIGGMLSEYRKEGHPSIYRKQWEPLTEEQLSNPKTYADCIHWCLPGVPDTWNELLYVYIFHR
ncbi:PMR5 N-terminal domain [Sesbania bispinosa]|nr:PMR5 N-terminal domain [Sesbania bispinosa]